MSDYLELHFLLKVECYIECEEGKANLIKIIKNNTEGNIWCMIRQDFVL